MGAPAPTGPYVRPPVHPSTYAPEGECGCECHAPLLSLTSVPHSINEPCLWVCQIRKRKREKCRFDERERKNVARREKVDMDSLSSIAKN